MAQHLEFDLGDPGTVYFKTQFTDVAHTRWVGGNSKVKEDHL